MKRRMDQIISTLRAENSSDYAVSDNRKFFLVEYSDDEKKSADSLGVLLIEWCLHVLHKEHCEVDLQYRWNARVSAKMCSSSDTALIDADYKGHLGTFCNVVTRCWIQNCSS